MVSAGGAEGLNKKVKPTSRRAYGLRTIDAVKTAFNSKLGSVPAPEFSHGFYW